MANDFNELLYKTLLEHDPEGSIKYAGKVALITGAVCLASAATLLYVASIIMGEKEAEFATITFALGGAAALVLIVIVIISAGMCVTFTKDRFALIARRKP
jgi:hypothetical protein